MRDDRTTDRLVELFDDLLGSGGGDYAADIVRETARVTQRPAWRFPGRWVPGMQTASSSAPAGVRALALIALIALLVLALVWALLAASRPRLPAPFGPAANGLLVFASDGDIWVADSPDGRRRPLITGPQRDNIAVWSPLGDRVAFLRHIDAVEPEGPVMLMVSDADGSDVRQLSGPIDELDGMAWSPDQATIAFGHRVDRQPGILLYATDGSGAPPFDAGMPAMFPAWRPPDGDQLAFLGRVGGTWTLHVGRVDGSEVYDLGMAGSPPWWSPDGQFISFDLGTGRAASGAVQRRIHVVHVDIHGRRLQDRALEFDAENDKETGAAWSPDGQWLAFLRSRGGRFRLAIGRPDGTGYLEIGEESGPPDDDLTSVWMWSPDGRWVFQTFDDGDTWILDPAGGPPRRAAFGKGGFTTWQRLAP